MSLRLASLVLLAGLAVACGGDSNPVNAYADGDYELTATATTDFDVNGGTCGDGSGTLIITEGQLSGTATSTNGNAFDISGSIAADGTVEGGFAVSGELVVNFGGTISGTEGSGTWSDRFECAGTWAARSLGLF